MDFLFIHGNYPAQFRHLASLLAREPGHRVVFLTARRDAASEPLPGLEIHTFQCHRSANAGTHHYLHASEEAVLQGQAVLRELAQLLDKGFRPRVVISHAGMGLGLFIKDLLPNALHVGYFEWFFRPETTRHLLEQFDLDAQLKTSLRNLPILQEMERCDVGVVPTAWQKSQFPAAYQHKLEVIFDGIDTSFFQPKPASLNLEASDHTIHNRESSEAFVLRQGWRVLTYATRGMEPLRGFPQFMRALPALLAADPELQVVIAGADRRAYSYDAPSHGGSWKEHLLAELGDFGGREQILFTGLLTYNDYRLLLWRSSLHCYFTQPYVTSWSLFEAAACGSRLAVSQGAATEGILDTETALWVDLNDQDSLTASLQTGLNTSRPAKILAGFELSQSLQSWEVLINRELQSS